MDINIFKTKEELSNKLSDYIINNHLDGSIAISGGSSPKLLFNTLSEKLNKNIKLKTKFYWVDERCVPPESEESNYKMSKESLFKNNNFDNKNIHRIKGEIEPEKELINYNNKLRQNLNLKNNIPEFDLIILGLGEDGHTASLFPHEFKIFKDEIGCVVASHPITGQKRISLSEKIINNAKEVIFYVPGSNKKHVVNEIINKKGNFKLYPASYINPTFGKLSWYLDFDASEKLIN